MVSRTLSSTCTIPEGVNLAGFHLGYLAVSRCTIWIREPALNCCTLTFVYGAPLVVPVDLLPTFGVVVATLAQRCS